MSYKPTFDNSVNRRSKYMKGGKEINLNLNRTENFDICICLTFDNYYQSFISGSEAGH